MIWEELRSTANEALGVRTSAKLVAEGLLLPLMGGARLRIELDRHDLWAGKDHVSLRELAEYFARYLYLPSARNRAVLVGAIQDGAKQLTITDTFATAAGYDEVKRRYIGLREGGVIDLAVDNETLLVKPEVAARQTAPISAPPAADQLGKGQSTAAGGPSTGAGRIATPTKAVKLNLFVGSVALDTTRIGRDAGRIAEEVIQHLSTLPGAEAEVTLEIQVRMPEGVGDDVVRTVTENCNSLKFKNHGFENE